MNRFESGGNGEARVRYLDADFQVLSVGSYVVCAVTGGRIPLDELKYWSVDREAEFDTRFRRGALKV
jgi:hypothetical protein